MSHESEPEGDAGGRTVHRDPPEGVKLALRREVGFGCPIQGCREPFLSWHHFDPPWSVRPHHDPGGIIALCLKHHGMADRGVYTKDRLHALKRGDHSVESVRAKFEWMRPGHLVRLGGCYMGISADATLIAAGGEEVLRQDVGAEGLLELSFVLRDARGLLVAAMRRNMFEMRGGPIFDLSVDVGGRGIKIRSGKRNILIDLKWSGIEEQGLRRLLIDDGRRSEQRFRDRFASHSAIAAPGDPAATRAPGTLGRMESEILAWATANAADSEGRVSLLDFRGLSIWNGGRRIEVKDGIQGPSTLEFCFFNGVGLSFE